MLANLTIIILTDRCDQIFLDCLESSAFAEEILIFDYQSGADWAQLKKSGRLRIIEKKRKISDFSAVRNEAISLVKTDWLLMLDSDEILPKKAAALIRRLIKNRAVAAYQVKREDFFNGKKLKHGELGQVWTTRLAQKNKIKFERAVHEVAVVEGLSKKAPLRISHLAHRNLAEFVATINDYAQLEAAWRYQKKWPYGQWRLALELIFFPNLKFILNYLLKLGFLDGWGGLNYAIMMSLHSLLVRVYLYEKYFCT